MRSVLTLLVVASMVLAMLTDTVTPVPLPEWPLTRALGVDIDVLLRDPVLPGPIKGLDLAEALRKAHSGLQVLLMTGLGAEIEATAAVESVLRKPFRRGELAARLREVLGSERPSRVRFPRPSLQHADPPEFDLVA
mgnify:CR=1 FL=1